MYKTMLAVIGGVTLLSGAALADGMPKGKAACCDAARPWTGFYIGVGVGAGAAVTELSEAYNGSTYHSFDGNGSEGVFGTVVVGYDRQLTSRIVGGIFADYDFASNVSTDYSSYGYGGSDELKNTLSVGARLGLLTSPTTLWYGTAGYTQTELGKVDFKGYFLGAGVESQLRDGWNLRLEYRFSQFGSEEVYGGYDGDYYYSESAEPSMHSARLALTYKWGREEAVHAPMK